MGYFKWRGGFFYRVWHLNAKYYSNGRSSFVRSLARSVSILALLLLLLSPPPSFFSSIRNVLFLCLFSLCGAPLGQEASFPDIQMRSNIIPGHGEALCHGFRADKPYRERAAARCTSLHTANLRYNAISPSLPSSLPTYCPLYVRVYAYVSACISSGPGEKLRWTQRDVRATGAVKFRYESTTSRN